MDDRHSVDVKASGLMLFVCLMWAFQSIGLKFTANDAAPVLQIGLRSGVGAVLVWLLLTIKGQRVEWLGPTALLGAVAGSLFAVNSFLIGEALVRTSASHVIVFVYTAPIFAAIGLHIRIPGERLGPIQWMGVSVAAGGIVYAFLWSPQEGTAIRHASIVWGDLLALVAGIVWGGSTVLLRFTRLNAVPASTIAFYQLATAFTTLTAVTLPLGYAHIRWSETLLLNLAFQGVVVSFCSFLIWFWLLTQYKASQLGVFVFLTPVLGVVLGHTLLGEPLTTEFVIGTACVILGVGVVTSYSWVTRNLSQRRHG